MTTRRPRRTSSLRTRFGVTYAVPQPSLTMSMYGPDVSSTSSHARGPRPLSITCVRPPWRGSKPSIELLQLFLGLLLDVVVDGVAVGVDPDGQRAEVPDTELPEALGHELLPGDLLDLLDLGRLERGRPADDGEVDHSQAPHRVDGLVGEAALAADGADAVLRAQRLGEAHHARARGRADADLLIAAVVELADARRGVEQEGAPEVHRRLDALVEDADLRAVADADDVPLDGHLVACAELQDLALVGDREPDFVRGHQRCLRWHWWMPGARAPSQARTQGAGGLGCPSATEDDAWRSVIAFRAPPNAAGVTARTR